MKITTQVTDVQLKTYEEATLLSLDPAERDDLAASLSLAAAQLRRPAGERTGLRARDRGDERRAHLGDRRRAGP